MTDYKEMRQCSKCGNIKPLVTFPSRGDNFCKGRRYECSDCMQRMNKVRTELKKTAPPKPDACECCGKKATLFLDHCHTTDVFRGWLCDHCNNGIGRLGDTKEAIIRALEYFDTVEKRKDVEEQLKLW